jgi:hypothetical protein
MYGKHVNHKDDVLTPKTLLKNVGSHDKIASARRSVQRGWQKQDGSPFVSKEKRHGSGADPRLLERQ